jgi:hypothetical protein
MPSYPPRSETVRKREILEKRERELKHALKNKFQEIKIQRAAEKVRTAQLNLIKAEAHWNQTYQISEESSQQKMREMNIKKKLALWQEITWQEIVLRYE